MNALVDSAILYRIIKLLSKPIEQSDAFKLGIIDKDGKQIKVPRSSKEKDSFTLLNRLIFRVQRLVNRNNPSGNRDLKNLAASAFLVKECYCSNKEPLNLELLHKKATNYITEEDIQEFEEILQNKPLELFSDIAEDAPINNSMATPGIERPETLLMGKKKVMTRKKANVKIEPFSTFNK